MDGAKRTVNILLVAVALLGGLVIIARLFFINYSIIPQNGMYPGLPSGSLILSWKRPYRSISEVKRGDIILFTRTENGVPFEFIWRVVALPGDTIEIEGDKIVLNGQPLSREALRQDGEMMIYREQNEQTYEVAYPRSAATAEQPRASLTVPENQLFVLGDNRFDARDSRYFGTIPFSSIFGRKL